MDSLGLTLARRRKPGQRGKENVMEADIINQIEGLQPVKGRGVTYFPYILFNKSPEQLRRLGACGGKANERLMHVFSSSDRTGADLKSCQRESP